MNKTGQIWSEGKILCDHCFKGKREMEWGWGHAICLGGQKDLSELVTLSQSLNNKK